MRAVDAAGAEDDRGNASTGEFAGVAAKRDAARRAVEAVAEQGVFAVGRRRQVDLVLEQDRRGTAAPKSCIPCS